MKPITKQEQEATATKKEGTDWFETTSVDTGAALEFPDSELLVDTQRKLGWGRMLATRHASQGMSELPGGLGPRLNLTDDIPPQGVAGPASAR